MSDFTATLGPVPRDPIPVPVKTVARWTGRLPAPLLEIWAQYGFADFAGGRAHFIDPARLAPVISFIFGDDPDFAHDTHAIAYGDLGEVIVWSQRYGYGFLSPVLSTIEMPNLTAQTLTPPEPQFIDMVLNLPADLIETFDPAGEKVYDRLTKLLGPLPYGMMYGTTPAPPPAEGIPVDHYVIAEVDDWLEAVYTERAVSVVDWGRPQPMIRFLGKPWPRGMKGNLPL